MSVPSRELPFCEEATSVGVIRDHFDLVLSTFEEVPQLLENLDNCREFAVMDVAISFGGGHIFLRRMQLGASRPCQIHPESDMK